MNLSQVAEQSGEAVRLRLRRLMALVLISFLVLWVASLVDVAQRTATRVYIVEDVFPTVQALRQMATDTQLAEQMLARAIAESDAYLVEDAQARHQEIDRQRERLRAVHGDDPGLARLALDWQKFAQESRQLALDILAGTASLTDIEQRAAARQRDREALYAAFATELQRWESALAQSVETAAQQSRYSAVLGGGLLLVLLLAVVQAVRLVARTTAQHEKRLQRHAREFATLYNETPALLLTTDVHQRCLSVSDFFARETGYRREQVIGHPLDDFLHKAAQPASARYDSGRWDEFEASLRLPDGSFRDVLARTRLQPDEDQRMLTVLIDITERKRAQRDLLELNETLEQRVRERTGELQAANASLSDALERLRTTQASLIQAEKLAALGSLVAGVSHELNTPIGIAVTVSSHLADEARMLARALDEGLRRSHVEQFVKTAVEATDMTLRNLTRSAELIQSFKRVAVDQTSEKRREFDLRRCLDEVLRTVHHLVRKAGCELVCDVPMGVAMDSYPGAIGQIVVNIVTNALVHAFEAETAGALRIVADVAEEGWVSLQLSDNGKGMSDEQLRRCFEPFYTSRLGQGGSGLGLHIAYNLATGVLGGAIDVRRNEPRGVVFGVRLPCSAPTHGRAEGEALPHA